MAKFTRDPETSGDLQKHERCTAEHFNTAEESTTVARASDQAEPILLSRFSTSTTV